MNKFPFYLLLGSTLSACGGGSSAPTVPAEAPDPDPIVEENDEQGGGDAAETPEPIEVSVARIFKGSDSDYMPTLSPSEETITMDVNGEKTVLTVIDGGNLSHRIGLGQPDNTTFVAGVQQSDDAEAGFVSAATAGDPTTYEGAIFVERLTDTVLPVTGEATFNGKYLGLVASSAAITGEATLTADFANSQVSGAITDRTQVDIMTGEPTANGLITTDMILEAGTLADDGSFSGAVSGGDVIIGGDTVTPTDGLYIGLVTGAAGDSAAVGLRTTFVVNDETGYEVGSFIAE